jgi:hypothetical protein
MRGASSRATNDRHVALGAPGSSWRAIKTKGFGGTTRARLEPGAPRGGLVVFSGTMNIPEAPPHELSCDFHDRIVATDACISAIPTSA